MYTISWSRFFCYSLFFNYSHEPPNGFLYDTHLRQVPMNSTALLYCCLNNMVSRASKVSWVVEVSVKLMTRDISQPDCECWWTFDFCYKNTNGHILKASQICKGNQRTEHAILFIEVQWDQNVFSRFLMWHRQCFPSKSINSYTRFVHSLDYFETTNS